MKQKIIVDGKAKEFKLRGEDHLQGVIKYKSSVTQDKKKVIERKRKYKQEEQF